MLSTLVGTLNAVLAGNLSNTFPILCGVAG
jgi:hypothetical protein